MGASVSALAGLLAGPSTRVDAQIPEEPPTVIGRVLLGDSVLRSGTVVLHQIGSIGEGEVDSAEVRPDGSFLVRLPHVPVPGSGEMFLAALRHEGVLYFGRIITTPAEADSIYEIHAYDTEQAPPEGADLVLSELWVSLRAVEGGWEVFESFVVSNEGSRTLVPSPGGLIWSYPITPDAKDVDTGGEMNANATTFENGRYVVRTPVPPGDREFAVFFRTDSLNLVLPSPGSPSLVAVSVVEPAPSLEIEGLTREESFNMDGEIVRSYVAVDADLPEIRITAVPPEEPPPVEWIAVVLALVLAGGGLLAFRGSARAPRSAAPLPTPTDRQAALLQLARLDEEYEQLESPSESRTREYRKRRADLLSRLGRGG